MDYFLQSRISLIESIQENTFYKYFKDFAAVAKHFVSASFCAEMIKKPHISASLCLQKYYDYQLVLAWHYLIKPLIYYAFHHILTSKMVMSITPFPG